MIGRSPVVITCDYCDWRWLRAPKLESWQSALTRENWQSLSSPTWSVLECQCSI